MGSEVTNKESDNFDSDQLQKSWSSAIESLRKSLNEDEEDLFKAKKGKKENTLFDMDEDEVAEDEEEEGEDSEEDDDDDDDKGYGKKKVKKSLSDIISEDSEAEVAMDIEPYLKSLADGFDTKIESIEKSIEDLSRLVKIQGKALLSSMEVQKSVQDRVQKIGDSPIPVSGVLKKSASRFGTDNKPEMNKEEIMQKAMTLCAEKKLSSTQVTIIEGRLNKGLDIPVEFQSLFTNNGGKA